MAQGAYLAPGSVKELKSCYVGAGGVKEVTQIYIGAGGVKFVWPPYIYSNGSFGPLCGGGGTALYNTSTGDIRVEFATSSIHIYCDSSNSNTTTGGVVFNDTLATGNYSSLSADFVINTVPTSDTYDLTFYVALYSTKPTSTSNFANSSYRAYYSSYTLNNKSAGTTYTCTLDMSSISGSYYVGIYVYTNRMIVYNRFDLSVSQVYVR